MPPPRCSPPQWLRLMQGETEARSSMEPKSWCFLTGKTLHGTGRTETFIAPTAAPDARAGDPIKRTLLALI